MGGALSLECGPYRRGIDFFVYSDSVVIRTFSKEQNVQNKRKALFIDVDGTLIRWVYCDYWVRACVEHGLFSKHILIELDKKFVDYKARKILFGEYVQTMLDSIRKPGTLKGSSVSAMIEVCDELAREAHVRTHVITTELIATAHQCNYFIAFISGSPTIALKSLMKYFPGVEVCLGSECIEEEGVYTGELDDLVVRCKDSAVRRLAELYNLNLEHSIAIGDSPSDAKMFQVVSHPVVLNPNTELDKIARENAWPIVIEKKMIHVEAWSATATEYVSTNLFDVLPKEIAEILEKRLVELQFL
jgi:phosphoserine phosphatase